MDKVVELIANICRRGVVELFCVQILKFAETASISKSRSPEVKSPLLMKMKKIFTLTFSPLTSKEKTSLVARFSLMMCQIYNTRNKNPVIMGGKTGKKKCFQRICCEKWEWFSFSLTRFVCTKGVGGKLKFVFFLLDRMAEERPQFILVR